jgi:hypothetical protein
MSGDSDLQPITSQDEIRKGATERGKKPGRPRRWANDAERRRQHRLRRREREELIEELLHAVRNADFEDRALRRRIGHGDDAEILRALIEHYRARNWMLQYRRSSERSR